MKAQRGSSQNRSQSDLSADLVGAGRGDREAFRRVYEATAGKLLALCFRITGHHSGAENVLQETFIKIWNRAPGFDPEKANATVWLGAIARNSAIDWYHANHRRSCVAGGEETAERHIIRRDENRALELLEELPHEQELEIRSVFFMGLTYEELAEREGLPVDTLKSRIRRGLQTLNRKFDDD